MDYLDCDILDYAWGDHTFIANLQGRQSVAKPEAEMWIGAHPKAPSRLRSTGQKLHKAIAEQPEEMLGPDIARTFGELPFLWKVLAASQPLSIQVHPNTEQAIEGFEKEEQLGLEITSTRRNYRDRRHKPELIYALTSFDALSGFRPITQTLELLNLLEEAAGKTNTSVLSGLDLLRSRLQESKTNGVSRVVSWVLNNSKEAQHALFGLLEAALCHWLEHGPDSVRELSWVCRLNDRYPNDPGIAVAFLMNLTVLRPGEAMFLKPGLPHAYLRGAGLELMANSDNVVRCGLTKKHLDVQEMLRIVDFTPAPISVIKPNFAAESDSVQSHKIHTNASEFDLTCVRMKGRWRQSTKGPQLLMVTKGELQIRSSGRTLELTPGRPVWIPARQKTFTVHGEGELFKCSVPTSS